MLTEKMETSVTSVSSRSMTKAPRIARPPTASGRLAATRPPKMTTSSTSTIGIDSCSARAMSSLTWVVMSLEIAAAAAETRVQPGGGVAQRGLQRLVRVHHLVVAGPDETHDRVRRPAVLGDQPARLRGGRPGRPGRGGRGDQPVRQAGEVALHRSPEGRVGDRGAAEAVEHDDVRRRCARRSPRSGPWRRPTRCPGPRTRCSSSPRRRRSPRSRRAPATAAAAASTQRRAPVDRVSQPVEHALSPIVC